MRYICQVDYIKWDTDGAEPPSDHTVITVELDSDATEDDISEAVSEKLSDDFGFCHKGFAMTVIDRLVQTQMVMTMWTSINEKQGSPLEWDWDSVLDLKPDEEVEVTPVGGDFTDMPWSK